MCPRGKGDWREGVQFLRKPEKRRDPEGVTEIGERAFDGCEKLKSVVIPEGLTKIGAGAFSDCEKLESVVIPKGVTKIGQVRSVIAKSWKAS